jgi:hypothetical protein
MRIVGFDPTAPGCDPADAKKVRKEIAEQKKKDRDRFGL